MNQEEQKCCKCDNPAELECKIGSCSPGTWWCSYHYFVEHDKDPEEEALKDEPSNP